MSHLLTHRWTNASATNLDYLAESLSSGIREPGAADHRRYRCLRLRPRNARRISRYSRKCRQPAAYRHTCRRPSYLLPQHLNVRVKRPGQQPRVARQPEEPILGPASELRWSAHRPRRQLASQLPDRLIPEAHPSPSHHRDVMRVQVVTHRHAASRQPVVCRNMDAVHCREAVVWLLLPAVLKGVKSRRNVATTIAATVAGRITSRRRSRRLPVDR